MDQEWSAGLGLRTADIDDQLQFPVAVGLMIKVSSCLSRSHPDGVHVGGLDDRLGLPGQDGALLGPEGAQLRPGGGHHSARIR